MILVIIMIAALAAYLVHLKLDLMRSISRIHVEYILDMWLLAIRTGHVNGVPHDVTASQLTMWKETQAFIMKNYKGKK